MGWTGTFLSHKKEQNGGVSAVEDLANLEKQLSHSLEEFPKRKIPPKFFIFNSSHWRPLNESKTLLVSALIANKTKQNKTNPQDIGKDCHKLKVLSCLFAPNSQWQSTEEL